MNANEEMLAGNADPYANYPNADPGVLNLNTCYADIDADLCIRIMSLCRASFRVRQIFWYYFDHRHYTETIEYFLHFSA